MQAENYLIHLCTGGLAHMARLLGNSISHAKRTGQRLVPISHTHSAFAINFYDVFQPKDVNGPIASADLAAVVYQKTEGIQGLGCVRLGDLRAVWRAPADFQSNEPSERSNYAVRFDGRTVSYPLALDLGATNWEPIQITTGEYSHTDHYKVLADLFESCNLTSNFSDYINRHAARFDSNSVAVHWRNTPDKTQSLASMVQSIRDALESISAKKIFLATDNAKSKSILAAQFPDIEIISLTPLPDLDGEKYKNLHSIPDEILMQSIGISKVDQVGFAFADLWCLSQAACFIPSQSEFSKLAQMFRRTPEISKSFFGRGR